MPCKIIFAKIDTQDKASQIAKDMLKKNLALFIDIIETKTYLKTMGNVIKDKKEYLLIAKTNSSLIGKAKKHLLKHISFERCDLVIFDTSDMSARLDMLLEKLNL
ncbi:MAG: hypothetical protein B6U87_01320 [Candidatus Aenigmarchaeota archaeon ex4484_52]|nr:MAG: hypothetical protein B6U87_01320 [Candidatus Aenigmarchaeota archaeon ex4484_52]